jgi:hypothetical protein
MVELYLEDILLVLYLLDRGVPTGNPRLSKVHMAHTDTDDSTRRWEFIGSQSSARRLARRWGFWELGRRQGPFGSGTGGGGPLSYRGSDLPGAL